HRGERSRALDPGPAVAGAAADPGDQGSARFLARFVEGGAQRPARPLPQAPLARRPAGRDAHHPRQTERDLMAALRWAALIMALAASGPALANDFVARTAGAATVIAID